MAGSRLLGRDDLDHPGHRRTGRHDDATGTGGGALGSAGGGASWGFDPYVSGGRKIVHAHAHAHDVGDVAAGVIAIGAAPPESGASAVDDGWNAIVH